MIDVITVVHNETNAALALELFAAIRKYESCEGWNLIARDNRVDNIGFGKGCNSAAFSDGYEHNSIIGFINPDCVVTGKFSDKVEFKLRDPRAVITGNKFGKPSRELRSWGVTDWVCGATFFVKRDWFTEVGGFDPEYEWSWEETDLVRLAESQKKIVRSVNLPILHASPTDDSIIDRAYKKKNFELGRKRYEEKWGPAPRMRMRNRR